MLGNKTCSIVAPAPHIIADTSQESHEFSNFVIFEVPENFANSEYLVLRGDENPVLCTKDQTCSIRQAETSNLMLLIQESSDPSLSSALKTNNQEPDILTSSAFKSQKINDPSGIFEVVDSGSCYFEALLCKPNPEILRELLCSMPLYNGKNDQTITTMDYLLDNVPASETEIRGFLKTLNAVEINGNIYFYLFRMLAIS